MNAELTVAELELLEAAREAIGRVTLARYDRRLSATSSDLKVLQKLIDDQVFDVADEQAYLSIGVTLGDAIAAETGFCWAASSFEGRTPALVLPGSSIVIFVVQMILKRVTDHEEVDLGAIFEWAKQLEREKT
jgi:hypothetical protein